MGLLAGWTNIAGGPRAVENKNFGRSSANRIEFRVLTGIGSRRGLGIVEGHHDECPVAGPPTG
jgi:hypothetical protein